MGPGERRSRAIMTVPPRLKLNTQEGASMMLIAATTVQPAEFAAGVEALRRAPGPESGLRAALRAMGFELAGDRLR